MDEFGATIFALGETLVMNIGRTHLASLEVRGWASAESADVLIWLHENTWDSQMEAIEHVEDVREQFMNDLSFEYRFVSEKESIPVVHDNASAYSLV